MKPRLDEPDRALGALLLLLAVLAVLLIGCGGDMEVMTVCEKPDQRSAACQ